MSKKIPSQYISEFSQKQVSLMKNRVGLFCIMVVGIYLFSTLINFIIYPKSLTVNEIPIIILLVVGGLIIFYLNGQAQNLRRTKLNAYLFTAFLFFIIAKTNLINYHDFKELSLPIYVFLLFLVSFIIPWQPKDIIPIAFMDLLTYSSVFLYIHKFMPNNMVLNLDFQLFFQGVMFICMTFCICVVIRVKESGRDVENFLLFKGVEDKNAQMQRELELATKVHKTLIPKSIDSDHADIAVSYLPIYYLGGDYAKFYFLDKKRIIFIICDVTGHGVSAALLVNRIHTEFMQLAQEGKKPGVLLKDLNNFIVKDFAKANMYISAFCGLLDFRFMKFVYSNYGHPAQCFYHVKDSQILNLSSQVTLLGVAQSEKKIYQEQIGFAKGDKILLFTDGVIETRNRQNEDYERGRLEEFIRKNHNLKAHLFNQKLLEELSQFANGKFRDDIFLLTINTK